MKNLLIPIAFLFGGFLMAQKPMDKPKKTTYNYGGYVKMDVINTWYENGDVSATSPIRDILLPGAIPIGLIDNNQTLDFHVKESRFNFEVTSTIKHHRVHAFLELDFLLSTEGNEIVSNSFKPRLRHFYFEWDDFLIGQTWSTFMIVVLPDDIDFTGALEGLVFNRQPQIRYKLGSWMFALENPETTYSLYKQNDVVVSDKEFMPDFVVRKNFGGSWGSWSITAIGSGLSVKDSLNIKRKGFGYGVSTGGKLLVGKRGDDFRIQATYGSGIGRYMNAGFISSSILDQQYSLQNNASLNGYLAYNHFWIKNKLSSSADVGVFQSFYNEDLVGGGLNQMAYSASINLKFDPFPKMRFGIEYTVAGREIVDGTFGTLHRLQLSAKYRFGFTDVSAIEK